MFVLKRCFSNAWFKVFFFILFLSVPGICLSSSCKDLFVSGGRCYKICKTSRERV